MNSSSRLVINKKGKETEILILPSINKKEMTVLLIWIILWTVGGLIVLSQLFTDQPKETKLFLAIWVAFWLYFEVKVIRAYKWGKGGRERIKINHSNIEVIKEINNKGVPLKFELSGIKNLRTKDFKKKVDFFSSMNDSFWNLGNESILFDYDSRTHGIGLKLNEKETSEVLRLLKSQIKSV